MSTPAGPLQEQALSIPGFYALGEGPWGSAPIQLLGLTVVYYHDQKPRVASLVLDMLAGGWILSTGDAWEIPVRDLGVGFSFETQTLPGNYCSQVWFFKTFFSANSMASPD